MVSVHKKRSHVSKIQRLFSLHNQISNELIGVYIVVNLSYFSVRNVPVTGSVFMGDNEIKYFTKLTI